jgi:hypothetical protein
MKEEYVLMYFRTSQVENLDDAIKYGAVREHVFECPVISLDDEPAAYAVRLIKDATDMMEHDAQICYNLVRRTEQIVQSKTLGIA